MIPRERVFAALSKQKTNMVPVDFRAEPNVEQRLIKELKLNSKDEMFDYLQEELL